MFTFWVVLWLEEVGMDVSHSLGTVSLDKPQILPYPYIDKMHSMTIFFVIDHSQ